MLMTMQDELGAVLSQHGDEGGAVDQPAVAPFGPGLRWVMDQYDTKHTGVLVEERGKPPDLRSAKPSGGTECQRRNRRADSNQNDGPASAHEWKPGRRIGQHGVATHIVGPMSLRMAPLRPHIGVVIAGHDGDVLRRAEPPEEGVGLRIFRWKRKIDQVAGDRDMVDGLCLQIVHNAVEHGGEMEMPAPLVPVDEAADTLA